MAGKLTNLEKYAIQGMINDDNSLSDIVRVIGKPEKVINVYLEKLSNDIEATKVVAEPEAVVIVNQEPLNSGDVNNKKLLEEYTPDILQEYKKKKEEQEQAKILSAAPEGLAKKFMPNKTPGGREGIVIMTEAASMVSDDVVKSIQLTKRSRTAKGGIYNIKEKKID